MDNKGTYYQLGIIQLAVVLDETQKAGIFESFSFCFSNNVNKCKF